MKHKISNNIITLELDREMAQCLCWAICLATGTSDVDDICFNKKQEEELLKLSSTLWKSTTVV